MNDIHSHLASEWTFLHLRRTLVSALLLMIIYPFPKHSYYPPSVVRASIWHNTVWFTSRLLEVWWHQRLLGTAAAQRLASTLAFLQSTGAAMHKYTSMGHPEPDLPPSPLADQGRTNIHTHTHARARTHGQNQPRPLCGQRRFQPAQRGIAAFGSPPLPLLFSLSPGENPSHSEEMKGRRGNAVCGKKSWTVRYYTVFNASFSIPAESTPHQC